jgi:hypothetical protein
VLIPCVGLRTLISVVGFQMFIPWEGPCALISLITFVLIPLFLLWASRVDFVCNLSHTDPSYEASRADSACGSSHVIPVVGSHGLTPLVGFMICFAGLRRLIPFVKPHILIPYVGPRILIRFVKPPILILFVGPRMLNACGPHILIDPLCGA